MGNLVSFDEVNTLVQEIVLTAPSGWVSLIFYQEIIIEPDQSLRNKSTAKCWVGDEMKLYERGFEIGSSIESFEAVETLFESSKRKGEIWTGILLKVQSDGAFNIHYFYNQTPLLDGKTKIVNEILNS